MKKRIFSAIAAFMIILSLIPPIPARATIDPATGGFLVCSFASLALELYKTWRSEHPNAPASSYPGYNPGGVVSSLAGGTTIRPDGGSSSSGSFGGDDGDLTPTPTPTPADFSSAYSDFVTTLPAPQIGNDGALYVKPEHDYYYYRTNGRDVNGNALWYKYCEHSDDTSGYAGGTNWTCSFDHNSKSIFINSKLSAGGTLSKFYFKVSWKLKAPVTGYYSTPAEYMGAYKFSNDDGVVSGSIEVAASTFFKSQGEDFTWVREWTVPTDTTKYTIGIVNFADLYLRVEPYTGLVDVYNTSSDNSYAPVTRPESLPITLAGAYGTMDAEGNILPINLDGLHIVNEDNGTVYNPITGDTTTYDEWNYDYSDRSYHFTDTSTGDTSTVTYGDENITINEGGNTYNIYYLVEAPDPTPTPSSFSSSSPTPTPVTPVHVHSYTDEIIREATCINPGSRLYTCLCGDSYTASIPALGHDWNVKSQVLTTYDDTGQVLQDGYIIYECSRCGEQYKDTSGQGLIPDTSESDELVSIVDQLQSWRLGFVQSYKNFSQLFADLFLFIPEELRKMFYWGFGASILTSVLFSRLRGR